MTADNAHSLLIVEDDLALQKQIKWAMDRFESVTAHDRESALVQMRRHNPAVVTMDLGLPPDADSVSEGFKLLEQLLAAQVAKWSCSSRTSAWSPYATATCWHRYRI